eukprot:Gb_21578 [translate_table: standard]
MEEIEDCKIPLLIVDNDEEESKRSEVVVDIDRSECPQNNGLQIDDNEENFRRAVGACNDEENPFSFLGVRPSLDPPCSIDPFRNHTADIRGLYEWMKMVICIPLAAVRLVLFGLVLSIGFLATKAAIQGWKDKHNPMPKWRCRLMWVTRICSRCILFCFGFHEKQVGSVFAVQDCMQRCMKALESKNPKAETDGNGQKRNGKKELAKFEDQAKLSSTLAPAHKAYSEPATKMLLERYAYIQFASFTYTMYPYIDGDGVMTFVWVAIHSLVLVCIHRFDHGGKFGGQLVVIRPIEIDGVVHSLLCDGLVTQQTVWPLSILATSLAGFWRPPTATVRFSLSEVVPQFADCGFFLVWQFLMVVVFPVVFSLTVFSLHGGLAFDSSQLLAGQAPYVVTMLGFVVGFKPCVIVSDLFGATLGTSRFVTLRGAPRL